MKPSSTPLPRTIEALMDHAGWMRGLARALVADAATADDVVQDTWVAALERPPRHERHLGAWLRRCLTNVALKKGRNERRRRDREHRGSREEPLPSTDLLVEHAETQRTVADAVLGLREPYRSAVILRYYHDHSPAEIAVRLGLPGGTVRSRLKRGLEELRDELDRRFGGDRRAWSAALLPWAHPAGVFALARTITACAIGVSTLLLGWMVWRGPLPAPRGPAAPAPTLGESRRGSSPAEEFEVSTVRGGAFEAPGRSHVDVPVSSPDREATHLYPGRVFGPDGAPVVGARLRITAIEEDPRTPVLVEGESDEDGEYRLLGPPPTPRRQLRLEVASEGFATRRIDRIRVDEFLDVKIDWVSEIRGRVIDAETEEPMEGIRVFTWSQEHRSGPDGEFRITEAVVGGRTEVKAAATGYARFREFVTVPTRDPYGITVRMRRGREKTLVVYDEATGEPMERVRIHASAWDHDVIAETDEEGRFTLLVHEGMDQGFDVRADGYATFVWVWKVNHLEGLTPGRIPMKRYGWIDGRVLDMEGLPQVDVPVWISDAGISTSLDTDLQRACSLDGDCFYKIRIQELGEHTDESGAFTLPVIPRERPFTVGGGGPSTTPVRGGPVFLRQPGQRVRIEARVDAAAVVRGRLVFNDRPWSRGRVYYELEDGTQGGWSRVDAEGRYEMTGVQPGRVLVRVRPDLFSVEAPEPIELEVELGRVHECDIAWKEPRVSIAGFGYEADGSPAAGVAVRATTRTERGFWYTRAETGKDGSFRLEVHPDLTYRVILEHGPATATAEGVAGGTEGLVLTLPRVASLRVRCIDAETKAPVSLLAEAAGIVWAPTGTDDFESADVEEIDGVATLRLPCRGPDLSIDLSVHAGQGSYRPKHLYGLPTALVPSIPEITVIELEPGLAVRLHLDPPEVLTELRGQLLFLVREDQEDLIRGPLLESDEGCNHRIDGIRMWIGDPILASRIVTFDAHGFASMRGLGPGRYRLRAFPDRFAFGPDGFELAEEETTIELVGRIR